MQNKNRTEKTTLQFCPFARRSEGFKRLNFTFLLPVQSALTTHTPGTHFLVPFESLRACKVSLYTKLICIPRFLLLGEAFNISVQFRCSFSSKFN